MNALVEKSCKNCKNLLIDKTLTREFCEIFGGGKWPPTKREMQYAVCAFNGFRIVINRGYSSLCGENGRYFAPKENQL